MSLKKEVKSGIYVHMKGLRYLVFCVVKDENEEQFVLYKEQYGEGKFWIRPYDNFYEEVKDGNNVKIKRFLRLQKDGTDYNESSLRYIVYNIKRKFIIIKHSETFDEYALTYINSEENKNVRVSKLKFSKNSSYLTDFQLAFRMGWVICNCNGELIVHQYHKQISKEHLFSLNIPNEKQYDTVNRDKRIIFEQLNPCSVDLHITEDNMYKTRRKKIDLMAVNNFQRFTKLWKIAKMRKYKGMKGIVLKPKQSLITYTMETIKVPFDCAGKIEIKSTYARLSLSVTNGDFCNPGWEGHFPLLLRNDGTNKIIIHPKERMLQLILLPLDSSVIKEYQVSGTYMHDDGTPNNFWRSKTLNKMREFSGNKDLLDFYEKIYILYENNKDEQERFSDTFLEYCEKNKAKIKFKANGNKIDVIKLYYAYLKREWLFSKLFSKDSIIYSSIGTILLPIIAIFAPNVSIKIITFIAAAICIVILLFFILQFTKFSPKKYCTTKVQLRKRNDDTEK